MTVQEYLDKHGSFKTARAILDRRVTGVCGLGLDDLPDTCEIGCMVETIQARLEDGDIKGAIEEAKEIDLDEIMEATW